MVGDIRRLRHKYLTANAVRFFPEGVEDGEALIDFETNGGRVHGCKTPQWRTVCLGSKLRLCDMFKKEYNSNCCCRNCNPLGTCLIWCDSGCICVEDVECDVCIGGENGWLGGCRFCECGDDFPQSGGAHCSTCENNPNTSSDDSQYWTHICCVEVFCCCEGGDDDDDNPDQSYVTCSEVEDCMDPDTCQPITSGGCREDRAECVTYTQSHPSCSDNLWHCRQTIQQTQCTHECDWPEVPGTGSSDPGDPGEGSPLPLSQTVGERCFNWDWGTCCQSDNCAIVHKPVGGIETCYKSAPNDTIEDSVPTNCYSFYQDCEAYGGTFFPNQCDCTVVQNKQNYTDCTGGCACDHCSNCGERYWSGPGKYPTDGCASNWCPNASGCSPKVECGCYGACEYLDTLGNVQCISPKTKCECEDIYRGSFLGCCTSCDHASVTLPSRSRTPVGDRPPGTILSPHLVRGMVNKDEYIGSEYGYIRHGELKNPEGFSYREETSDDIGSSECTSDCELGDWMYQLNGHYEQCDPCNFVIVEARRAGCCKQSPPTRYCCTGINYYRGCGPYMVEEENGEDAGGDQNTPEMEWCYGLYEAPANGMYPFHMCLSCEVGQGSKNRHRFGGVCAAGLPGNHYCPWHYFPTGDTAEETYGVTGYDNCHAVHCCLPTSNFFPANRGGIKGSACDSGECNYVISCPGGEGIWD